MIFEHYIIQVSDISADRCLSRTDSQTHLACPALNKQMSEESGGHG